MRFHRNISTVKGACYAKVAKKMVQNSRLLGQLSGRIETRTESRPPPDSGNTLVGDPPRKIRVFRTICGLADSIRGLRAVWPTPPRGPRGESARAPTHWRCHGVGTRRPPLRSRSPTRPRPPSRKRIRNAGLLLLLRPLERLRYLPTFCTARRSSGPRPAPAP